MNWDRVHDLVKQAKKGDEAAWTELHSLVQPYLLSLAKRLVGPDWPERSGSDLVSATWLRALKGIDNFKGGVDDSQTAP